jgi:hypothetical protein
MERSFRFYERNVSMVLILTAKTQNLAEAAGYVIFGLFNGGIGEDLNG